MGSYGCNLRKNVKFQFLSTPVLQHGGLICIALSVCHWNKTGQKVTGPQFKRICSPTSGNRSPKPKSDRLGHPGDRNSTLTVCSLQRQVAFF